MADSKITALTALTSADPANDMIPIVDVSDTPPASGNTKRISINNILAASGTATLASATITGAATVGTTLGVTGVSTFAAGTALLPALTTTGDTNTGIYYPAADTFAVTTGGTERYRVDSAGNCGIGVTPSASWVTYKALEFDTGIVSGSSSMALNRNCYFDGVNWRYKVTTTFGISQYQLSGNGSHSWKIASSGSAGALINGTGAWTDSMTLDASGNLHVGTTAYVNVATNVINSLSGFNLVPNNTGNAANRNWQLAANGSAAGNFDFTVSSANNTYPNSAYRMQLTSAGALNNTTGTYGTISDLRLKENISDARNYLADLLKLRVVKYSLKEESSAVATKLGFIAQEVEQVFPNLVDQSDKEYEGAEGIRSVKTSILIPMLLKGIQELTARVQTLEAR